MKLLDGGSDTGRLNLVLLAEGYTAAEQPAFNGHAKQLADAIAREKWYRQGLLNVHGLFILSKQSARQLHANGGPRDTAFKAEYGGKRAAHVISGDDEWAKRIAAEWVPMHAIVLVNCTRYGGKGGGASGGIVWTYTDAGAPARWTACALHELGHSLAGLADEYGSSEPASPLNRSTRKQEPPQANITLDPRGAKWRHLVTGAVEGGDGYDRGIYRPTRDCRMRSLTGAPFCPVCADAMRRALEEHLSEPAPAPELENIFWISGSDWKAQFKDTSAGCLEAVQYLLKRQFGP